MPHIPKKQRRILQPGIKKLIEKIKYVLNEHVKDITPKVSPDIRNVDGIMNYVICRLLIEIFDLKNNPKYTKFNTIEGIINQVGRAIYEGFVSPYEQKKIEENGNALME